MKQIYIVSVFLLLFVLVLTNNKILNSILGRLILLSALVICTNYSQLLGLVLVIILTVVYSSSMIWSNSYMSEGMSNHKKRERSRGARKEGSEEVDIVLIKDKLDMEHYFRPKRKHIYKKYDVAVPYSGEPIYYSMI